MYFCRIQLRLIHCALQKRMEADNSFLLHIESSLRFAYSFGGVTPMQCGWGDWRTLPTSIVAQIMHGHTRVWCENETFEVGSGEAFFIAPGVRHTIENYWPGTNLSRWSHFNVFGVGSFDIMMLFEVPHVFRGETAQRLGDINERLATLHERKNPDLRQLVERQALGLEIVSILANAGTVELHSRQFLYSLERLGPVLTFIAENLARPITREAMANQVHLSPTRFYALFKEALGVSPTEYLQDIRMQHAQRLLLNSSLSVSEVAAQSGYPDAFHFSRLFRRRYGISPLRYRKQTLIGLGGRSSSSREAQAVES